MRTFKYYSTLRALFIALTASLACDAQNVTLGLSSTTGAPGSAVSLNVSLDTQSGLEPSAVEWTLNYPASDFSSVTATPDSPGKSVSCSSSAGSTTCMLWGENSTTIGDGAAATVSMVISPTTQDTTSQIQISSPMASSPAAYALASTATGGTVTILQPAALDGFSCTPSSLTPPAVSTCTVQLSAAAPSAGASIGLVTSLPDVIIPSTVTIASGLTSGVFTATPLTVSSPTAINLTASYLGVNEGFGLTVNPGIALMGFTLSRNWIVNGGTDTGSVTISEPAGSGGVTVALSSSNTHAVTVPASVTIPQGATTASFTATAGTVLAGTPVDLTASFAGVNMGADLSVYPPVVLTSLTLNPVSVISGQTATGTITISEPAGAAGLVVGLLSSNTGAATVPATVTIAKGATTAVFTITAGTVTTATSLSITAMRGINHKSTNLTVIP